MRYASETTVSVDRSRREIENILDRWGGTEFAYGKSGQRRTLMFSYEGRRIRFDLIMPTSEELDKGRRGRKPAEARADTYERQVWRALALGIKAKLAFVEAGITTFEEEFLAHVVLPDGSKFGEWARPQLAQVYEGRGMPALLGGPSNDDD